MNEPIITGYRNLPAKAGEQLHQSLREMENRMKQWMIPSPFSTEDWAKEDYFASEFAPACNLKENGKQYTVQFDVPGVKIKDLSIEIENGCLTVRGERSEKKEERDAKHFLTEISYGSFARTVYLPVAVNEDKIDAHYEDGILTVAVPKLEPSRSRQIKIH